MNQNLIKITELRQQLIKQGYYPFQIDSIIHDKVGNQSVESLSSQESHSLLSFLEEYISFAKKCKETNK